MVRLYRHHRPSDDPIIKPSSTSSSKRGPAVHVCLLQNKPCRKPSDLRCERRPWGDSTITCKVDEIIFLPPAEELSMEALHSLVKERIEQRFRFDLTYYDILHKYMRVRWGVNEVDPRVVIHEGNLDAAWVMLGRHDAELQVWFGECKAYEKGKVEENCTFEEDCKAEEESKAEEKSRTAEECKADESLFVEWLQGTMDMV